MKEHKHYFKKCRPTLDEKKNEVIGVVKCKICDFRLVISSNKLSKKELEWAQEVINAFLIV